MNGPTACGSLSRVSAPASFGGSADWTPDSWRGLPLRQVPNYADEAALLHVERRLASFPPLVSPERAMRLRALLQQISQGGRGFLLQAGDCAESIDAFSLATVRSSFELLQGAGQVLASAVAGPVVCLGRIAGQYAKPRTDTHDTVEGQPLPVYRGDIVNAAQADMGSRRPDPSRMERAYFASAATLNCLHGLAGGGSLPMFTSHEALLLNYEQALLQRGPCGGWFAGSGDLLWIGVRTADPDGAHVEFLRGLRNPIGLKVGPQTTPAQLETLLKRLNPENEPGRLLLISRMGAGGSERLRELMRFTLRTHRSELWICDPMHGNTFAFSPGLKTRRVVDIEQEFLEFMAVHQSLGRRAQGLHLEASGLEVTECLSGDEPDPEAYLRTRYQSLCDPRLNRRQAQALVARIAGWLSALAPAEAPAIQSVDV